MLATVGNGTASHEIKVKYLNQNFVILRIFICVQECPLTDKHLLLMHNRGIDEETATLAKDFIHSTDFYIRLGITYLHFITSVSVLCNNIYDTSNTDLH